MQVTPGEHVIDQGDDGDNFYVIDRYVDVWAHLPFSVRTFQLRFSWRLQTERCNIQHKNILINILIG